MHTPTIIHEPNPYGARRIARRTGKRYEVDTGVIHAMRARFLVGTPTGRKTMQAPAFLRSIKRSAHGFVTRKGDIIHSVPWTRAAWHAAGVNMHSIGLEVLVYDDAAGLTYPDFLRLIGHDHRNGKVIPGTGSPFFDAQYPAVGYWMACAETWAGRPLKWIGHFQCSKTKLDPGPLFNMDKALAYRDRWLRDPDTVARKGRPFVG